MDKVGKHTLEIMNKARFYNNWLYSFLTPYLGSEILEIGAGIGNFTGKLAKNARVTTIDINKVYIKRLKKLNIKNSSVGYGDIEKGEYFFKNKKFDTVVCLNVLEHIEDDQKALKNMHRVLNTGGHLLLLVPAHQSAFSKIDKNLGHYRRYTRESAMEAAKKAGFNNVTTRYLNVPGLFGWYVNGKLLRRQRLPSKQLSIFDKLFAPWLLIEKRIKLPIGLSVFLVATKE